MHRKNISEEDLEVVITFLQEFIDLPYCTSLCQLARTIEQHSEIRATSLINYFKYLSFSQGITIDNHHPCWISNGNFEVISDFKGNKLSSSAYLNFTTYVADDGRSLVNEDLLTTEFIKDLEEYSNIRRNVALQLLKELTSEQT